MKILNYNSNLAFAIGSMSHVMLYNRVLPIKIRTLNIITNLDECVHTAQTFILTILSLNYMYIDVRMLSNTWASYSW